MRPVDSKNIGVVVIGRNEGIRLQHCFESLEVPYSSVVYVDSGSTDKSVGLAESLGIAVVKLDETLPFSAGRARNEGFSWLIGAHPELEFVQFVDGDCRVFEGWLAAAYDYLSQHKEYSIVAGRRKEIDPESSRYNLLCDIEWDTPIGDADACGGDFMIRSEAFLAVGGFNPQVIAGEEPELCYRLRQKGGKVYRADQAMTLHDAAIYKFSQWWKRCVRSGHAYAQGCVMHGREAERYNVKESLKIWVWAFILPLMIVLGSIFISKFCLLFFGIYLLQAVRIFKNSRKRIENSRHRVIYSLAMVIIKFPEFAGQISYLKKHVCGDDMQIIEYQ